MTEAKLEAAALELSTDEDYFRDFRVPGICAMGGLRACIALAAERCRIETF